MEMGPATRRIAPIWAGATLLVLGVTGTCAQGEGADMAEQAALGVLRDTLRTWTLYEEIQVLETANRIGLTSDQARRCAAAIEAPLGELWRIRELEASDQLREALTAIRATMLTGREPTEGQWAAVHSATAGRLAPAAIVDEGEAVIERRKAELADQIGTAIAGELSDEQLERLGSSESEEIALSIAEELPELRAAAPAEWTAYRAEVTASIRQFFTEVGGAPEEKVVDDIGTFLDRVRAMNTDAYFAQQDQLRDELVRIVAGEAQTPEARRMRATNRLGEWAEVWPLMELLRSMAAAERHIILQ